MVSGGIYISVGDIKSIVPRMDVIQFDPIHLDSNNIAAARPAGSQDAPSKAGCLGRVRSIWWVVRIRRITNTRGDTKMTCACHILHMQYSL